MSTVCDASACPLCPIKLLVIAGPARDGLPKAAASNSTVPMWPGHVRSSAGECAWPAIPNVDPRAGRFLVGAGHTVTRVGESFIDTFEADDVRPLPLA